MPLEWEDLRSHMAKGVASELGEHRGRLSAAQVNRRVDRLLL